MATKVIKILAYLLAGVSTLIALITLNLPGIASSMVFWFISFAAANQCEYWASEINKSEDIAFIIGLVFSVFGFIGYGIYFYVKKNRIDFPFLKPVIIIFLFTAVILLSIVGKNLISRNIYYDVPCNTSLDCVQGECVILGDSTEQGMCIEFVKGCGILPDSDNTLICKD